jgi:hypothetical protein
METRAFYIAAGSVLSLGLLVLVVATLPVLAAPDANPTTLEATLYKWTRKREERV